jgi:hypothetical protein
MINQGLKEGKRERDILKDLSVRLKRGYAGIMSHVRKLRSEYPERFHSYEDFTENASRLNSWTKEEEELVIETVNRFAQEGKSLTAAIAELEKELPRTQGAIYQRIYTLRRKHPERFSHLPAERPRRRRKLPDWQFHLPVVRPLDEGGMTGNGPALEELQSAAREQLKTAAGQLSAQSHDSNSDGVVPSHPTERLTTEEEMVLKAFEELYGRPNAEARHKLMRLMRTYANTKVSIALFKLSEDKSFPNLIVDFLENRLQRQKFL